MKLSLSILILLTSSAFAEQDKSAPSVGSSEDSNLYSPFGKRDPFRIPDRNGLGRRASSVNPVQKYRLEGYKLKAVLRLRGKPQAMFQDPDGKSHIVNEGDLVGMEGARVSRILNSEVIVTERSSNYLGKETLLEKIISLPAFDKADESLVAPVSNQPLQSGTSLGAAGAAAIKATDQAMGQTDVPTQNFAPNGGSEEVTK